MKPSRRETLKAVAATAGTGFAGCLGSLTGTEQECDTESREVVRETDPRGTFPTYRADAGRSGYVSGTASDRPGELLWRVKTGSPPNEPRVPVVGDGRVYVCAGALYALDQRDGSLAWCAEGESSTPTGPTITSGSVVLTEWYRGGLFSYEAASGSHEWRFRGHDTETPPTVHGDTAYLTADPENQQVAAVDLSSRSVRWRTPVEPTASVPPPLSVTDAGVFVQQGGRLRALDTGDGSELWHTAAGTDVIPAVSDGVVYSRRDSNRLAAWNVADGSVRWTADVLDDPSEVRTVCAAGDGVYASTPDQVLALDADDGALRWRRHRRGIMTALGRLEGHEKHALQECLVTDDRVYLGFSGGLAALDRTDGRVLWDVAFPGGNHGDAVYPGRPGGLAVAGGAVYALTPGTVYAVGA